MSHVYLTSAQEAGLIKELASKFPPVFGLRAWPRDRFRISERDSLWSCGEGCILLYTEILIGGKWVSFAKGSYQELASQYFPLP